jgi:hypothetical protein
MRLAAILTTALLATTACSDSTAPVIQLTDDEVALLFAELGEALGEPPTTTAGSGNQASLTTSTVSATLDCVNGGTVSVNGSSTQDTNVLSMDFTEVFHACETETFTIGGSLRFTATLTTLNDSSRTLNQALKGTITATHSDGRSGSCLIDMTLDLSESGDTFNLSASGTICGRNADVVVNSTSG